MARRESADQTEKPTPKRLRDARKEGEVPKSRDLTSTVVLTGWLLLIWLAISSAVRSLLELGSSVLAVVGQVGHGPLPPLLIPAARTLLWTMLPALMLTIAVGLLADFLQVGALFVAKKAAPDAARMNPIEGLSRIFSQENMVEVIKSLLKTLAIALIFVLVVKHLLPEMLRLPMGRPPDMASTEWHGLLRFLFWTVCGFFLLAVFDSLYQRYAFIRRHRMSRRDIRQELKDSEGDPQIKGRRREVHVEWARYNMMEAVRKSSAVVVNPEHIAVAILYDPDNTAVPIVSAKGEDYEAQLIRQTAEEAGVPVMRNIELARGLHAAIEVDEYISSEFFQAIAELLRWAETVRQQR